jgi:putative methylase
MSSKSSLAIELSKLKLFSSPDVKLEQYPTDSEIAAEVLWNAHMLGDIENAVIADLGCGTGILGIGALLLRAKKIYFIDIDKDALQIAKNNCVELGIEENCVFINKKIKEIKSDSFDEKVDLVIQNPPFGTKEEHADKQFLEKAFEITKKVISFHKESTKVFVEAITKDHKFNITHHWKFKFPIKQTQKFHKKKIQRIDVSCWRMVSY